MSDLIKRSDAIKAMADYLDLLGVARRYAKSVINKVPSAEPKQGEWICHEGIWVDKEYYPPNYECNNCHHFVISGSDRNFCPNCGADMRGKYND